MRSEIALDMAAPPELVFRLARDIERWPRLLPHYAAVDEPELAPDRVAPRARSPGDRQPDAQGGHERAARRTAWT